MQQRQQRATPPGLIYDSDMGANIDAALALAVLYGASAKVKLIGVTVSNPSLEAAAFCEVMGRFYASGGKLNSTPSHYNAPVGFAGDGSKSTASPMLAKAIAATWNPIEDITDTAEIGIVFRNALTTQKDGEGMVLLAGPATNLIRAMGMPGNKELLAAKAGVLILAAGAFDNSTDPRIKADIPAARKLIAEWPNQIVFVGKEAAARVPYPGSSIVQDFAWAEKHPLVEAYKAYKPGPYDAPSQAVLAALYASNPKDELLELSNPGTVEVQADGGTKFTPSGGGKHQYLLPPKDPAAVIKAFTALAATKPTAPAPRFRPQQQQQQAAPQQAAQAQQQ